ncbi:MAG: hypothetical protein ACHQRM_03715 [Bacteroidia bacterium]
MYPYLYMKVITFLFIFCCSLSCFAQQDIPMENKLDFTRFQPHQLIQSEEVTVGDWLGYVTSVSVIKPLIMNPELKELTDENWAYLKSFKYPKELMPDSAILNNLPWKNILSGSGSYETLTADYSSSHMPFPVNESYYHIKIKRKFLWEYLDMPITGITYEQALGYCKWKTVIDSINCHGGRTAHYRYRLPDPETYTFLNENRDSVGKKCRVTFNYKNQPYHKIRQGKKHGPPVDSIAMPGYTIVSTYHFYWDKNHLSSIQGNAAEMTSTKGIAMGGSYVQYAKDCSQTSRQLYTKPEPWLGFRCMTDDKLTDTCAVFKHFSPRSFGLVLGIQGYKNGYAEAGIGNNLIEQRYNNEGSGFFGWSLTGKQYFNSACKGVNADVWLGYMISFGINYNYTFDSNLSNHGVKPYVGFFWKNVTLTYGYNIHGKTNIKEVNDGEFMLRYYLPVLKRKAQ